MNEIRLSVEDYDAMRKGNLILVDQVRKYEQTINDLDPEALRQQAVDLAMALTNKYLAAIFKKLGFSVCGPQVINFSKVKNKLGDNWHYTENFTVELGVVLGKEFRQAFIELGVAAETLPEVKENLEETKDLLEVCAMCDQKKKLHSENLCIECFNKLP